MTTLLTQIFALVKLLNSDKGTNQIAAGVAVGLILGFAPLLSLQTVIAIVILFFFRIQLGAAAISAFFFKFVAYLVDPLADPLGQWALELESLRPLYTELYNLPIVPFTRFNNSVVMGSAILSVALFPLVYFTSKLAVLKYRVHLVERLKRTRFWKLIQGTGFYKWYVKYEHLRS